MSAMLVYACSALLLITALIHSVLGERRLIVPLLRSRDGILGVDMARFLLRFVWHFMSVLFTVIAVALIAYQQDAQGGNTVLLMGTAIAVGGAGLLDAVATRGRHIGWPLLVLIGLLALLAIWAR